jgi:hypothetical protein
MRCPPPISAVPTFKQNAIISKIAHLDAQFSSKATMLIFNDRFETHRRDSMKHYVPDSKASFALPRPFGLDSKTWRYVKPISEALQQAQHQTGRFRFYGYLGAVYRTYKEWKNLGISKGTARHLAEQLKVPRRKGTSPVRILIDATFPALDPKQKSRWSRALEFAVLKNTTPDDLPKLFNGFSGIAGCARAAAKEKPKKNINRNDWI